MKKLSALSILFALIVCSASAGTRLPISGRDTILLASLVSEGGIALQGSNSDFFGMIADPVNCGKDKFKSQIIRVQSGRVDCFFGDAFSEVTCNAYTLDGSKKIVLNWTKGWELVRILKEARVPVSNESHGYSMHTKAIDCNFKGYETCLGKGECSLDNS